VTASVRVLEKLYAGRGQTLPLVLLHCVSAYPTPADQANLKAITTLATLGYPVGYSDHTLGTQASVMAVALGARVLEKHFTISKTHSDFRDHQLSADPQEMRELVERVREANSLLGDGVKRVMKDEQAVAAKRSIAAARDLPAGHRLVIGDLAWLRPADGLTPGNEDLLLGRALRGAVRAGHRFAPDELQD
jgi:sialic acid synthase SpsE